MPRLVRFIVWNFTTGAAIGWLCLAMLLWTAPDGLGLLVAPGPDGAIAAALLGMSFAGSFGLGYLGTALALLPERE